MILEVTYADGHHECFDSNSLTGGAVFGRANILTEFDVVWEDGEEGQHLVVYEHHMEESAPSDDEASANADRIRGPRLKLVDSSEVRDVESVSLDGRLLAWSQGGCLVDAARFELACMKWYSGPMGAGANAKAVALFGPAPSSPATRPKSARCSATQSLPSGRPRTRSWPRRVPQVTRREAAMKWVRRVLVATGAFLAWLFRAVFRWFM